MIRLLGFGARVTLGLVQRPKLIPTALRQLRTLAPNRWWASAPFLPLPRRDYLEFRSVTLSGDPDALPEVDDVLTYLEWCRSMRELPSTL